MTTTDVLGDQGELVGALPVVSSSTPNEAAVFSANAHVGTNGSGNEQGLQASFLAIHDALNGGVNEHFLRESADLRVIHVSDEPDQSVGVSFPEHGQWPASEFATYLQNSKSSPERVAISDISGGLAGCASAGPGTDYVLATQLTGGISASICDSNWAASLTALAWLSQVFADTFELSDVPVGGSVEVWLDGVERYEGWIYDPVLNAVVFDASHVPEDGELIEVEYVPPPFCSG